MEFSFYQIYWIFVIYAFIGWCSEVAFVTFKTGQFVNRGFLNGPVCPIYGFGMVIVVALLTPLKFNFLLLFFGAAVLTSLLELVTGFVLEKFFHQKWWDYSDIRFNIKGYVCLRFSILWGVACAAVMYLVEPLIENLINIFPHIIGIVLLCVISATFATDLVLTVATLLKIRDKFRRLEEIEAKMRKVSDEIGEGISKSVVTGMQKVDEHQDEIDELKAKLDELKEKMDEINAEHHFGMKRIRGAFPALKKYSEQRTVRFHERIDTLRTKIKQQ